MNTFDIPSSVAGKDQYLRMQKNKDHFTRKVVVDGGIEVQSRSKIPTFPSGARQSQT